MTSIEDQIFKNYWSRKRLLEGKIPLFPLKKWFPLIELCEIEVIYFEAIKSCKSLLDVGAGDLRLMKKFVRAGYKGEYHTQDISTEHPYTYQLLSEVDRKYEAIICMDVLEHMSLHQGLEMIQKMASLLSENGTLILQTPNARCIRNPMGGDMTHLHCYNLSDLWAYLSCEGFQTRGFRIVLSRRESLIQKLQTFVARIIITKMMGCDYADNIAVIGKKSV